MGVLALGSIARCWRALALAVVFVVATTLSAASTASTASAAGTVTEFPVTAGSAPRGIAAGPHGNLWFTEQSGNRVGRITPGGAVTEFSTGITPNSGPSGIALGPDGNMWFTEQDRIGRITPSGTVSEVSLSPGRVPLEITAGPDGNLWFTEVEIRPFAFNANRIGRITPSGTVTEFSAGINPDSQLENIAGGPDGNVWFTEHKGNVGGRDQIGRITPSGTVTEFSAGITPNSGPTGIAAGPDGNLWFTEPSEDRIGRITPSGTVTEFSLERVAAGPDQIAKGPDGNMWFTEDVSSIPGIGRITPSGRVTEFSDRTPTTRHQTAVARGIAAGGDGNMWFTEPRGDRIGRITTGAAPTPRPRPSGPHLVGFGDSVAAGYGLSEAAQWGPSDVGLRFENGAEDCRDTPAAYPCVLAKAKWGDESQGLNYAIQGASSNDVLKTGGELARANQDLTPTQRAAVDTVTLTVGADDIRFDQCIEAEIQAKPNPCLARDAKRNLNEERYAELVGGTKLKLSEERVAELRQVTAKIRKFVRAVRSRSGFPKATIYVTTYYQFVPGRVRLAPCGFYLLPAAANLQNSIQGLPGPVVPGVIAAKLPFLPDDAVYYQDRFARVADFFQGQLNAAIRAGTRRLPAVTVEIDQAFRAHDICSRSPWVFSLRLEKPGPLKGQPLPPSVYTDCPHPSDKSERYQDLGLGTAVFSNCLPHPTYTGQQVIARAVGNAPPTRFNPAAISIDPTTGKGSAEATCLAPRGQPCRFVGVVQTPGTHPSRSAHAARRTHRAAAVELGAFKGRIPAGMTGRIRIELNRAGRSKLPRSRTVKAQLAGTVSTRRARVQRFRQAITLKARTHPPTRTPPFTGYRGVSGMGRVAGPAPGAGPGQPVWRGWLCAGRGAAGWSGALPGCG